MSTPVPLCDIPSGCCFFTLPWTVTRSSLRMLRRVAAFCRPLRPVLLLVSFPRSRSPVVGVLGLCTPPGIANSKHVIHHLGANGPGLSLSHTQVSRRVGWHYGDRIRGRQTRGAPNTTHECRPPTQDLAASGQLKDTARRVQREEVEGGGGSGTQKLCVLKMAQPDFPNGKFRVFPRWSLGSGGGGGET